MIIKKCIIEDLHLVADLFNRYRIFYGQASDLKSATTFIKERLSADDSVIFLAVNKHNQATGFTQLYPSFTSVGMNKIWILNDLFVHDDHRRMGIAKSIMEKAVLYAKESGSSGLVLETGADNFQAQKLYESIGWSREENLIYQYAL